MLETHISSTNNDCLLSFVTSVGFKICHRPLAYGPGDGVGIFINHNIVFKIVDSPTYVTFFENIVIARPFQKSH